MNELTVKANEAGIERHSTFNLSDLSDTSAFYTSMKIETPEDQKLLAHTMMNPDTNIRDCINTVIEIKDVFCEIVELTDVDGKRQQAPRIVLIDTKGKSYASVSTGIWGALKKLFMIYGAPTWEKGIKVKVRQLNKKDRAILTLDIE